jgi:hypothetical protein
VIVRLRSDAHGIALDVRWSIFIVPEPGRRWSRRAEEQMRAAATRAVRALRPGESFPPLGKHVEGKALHPLLADGGRRHRQRHELPSGAAADGPGAGGRRAARATGRAREVFPNCPRYIHRYELVERSRFVPRDGAPPPVPEWKRREWARDVLPGRD